MVTVYVALAQKEQRAVTMLIWTLPKKLKGGTTLAAIRYHIPGKISPIIHTHYGKYNSYWLGIFSTTIQYSSTCTSL